jgi:hypothetical protein
MTHHHETSHDTGAVSLRSPGILAGVAVLVLLLVAALGALWINRSGSATELEDAARSAERAKNLTELQAADEVALSTYGWVDKPKGIVHIPIARAMELVLPTLKNSPAKSGQPSQQ